MCGEEGEKIYERGMGETCARNDNNACFRLVTLWAGLPMLWSSLIKRTQWVLPEASASAVSISRVCLYTRTAAKRLLLPSEPHADSIHTEPKTKAEEEIFPAAKFFLLLELDRGMIDSIN